MNRAALQPNTTKYVGSRLTKMVLGVHIFTSHPKWGAGDLTAKRDAKYGEIHHRNNFYRIVGTTYLMSGVKEALKDFVASYHLSGIRRWGHIKSNFERNVPRVLVPATRVPHLTSAEEILGYNTGSRIGSSPPSVDQGRQPSRTLSDLRSPRISR
jgi:hypothetical protein